jgi:hypothetical protein
MSSSAGLIDLVASAPIPHVWVQTLGTLSVCGGAGVGEWKGGGLGKPQLKAMLSYLITYPNRWMHWTTLAAIGSPRSDDLKRPRNLFAGLQQLLNRWGLKPAIRVVDGLIRLTTHQLWTRDVDLLQQYANSAARHHATGETEAELVALRRAADLCGGLYLPQYDHAEFGIIEVQQYWEHVQRDIIHQCVTLLYTQHQFFTALEVAEKLPLLSDQTEAEDDLLLAKLYDALRQPNVAHHYRQRAREKMNP